MPGSWLPPFLVRTVLTCLLWYLVSSLTSQSTKTILLEYNYPLFLSQFQFFIGSLLSLCFIVLVRRFPHISRFFPLGSVPQSSDSSIFNVNAFLNVLPLGLFQFCGKYCSLSATSLISLATVSSIKALSPLLIVVGYKVVYSVKFPLVTYLSLVPLVGGVILLISEENPHESLGIHTDHIKGLIFCFISIVIFAAQNIYGKQLITWNIDTDLAVTSPQRISKFVRQRNPRLPYSVSDLRLDEKKDFSKSQYVQSAQTNKTSERITKPDRMTIIFYCSMIGFTISSIGFLLNEFPHIWDLISGRVQESTPDTKSGIVVVFYLIGINSISHFLQTLLAFHLLGLIPAVTYSIASMMKRIVLITVSIILASNNYDPHKYFGKLTGVQLLGLFSTGFGLYCYDKWGSYKEIR